MRKKGLLIVVALLAIASLMAAMAVNTAKITNAGELKVKNTAESLVGLTNHSFYTGTVGNKDATVTIVDGELVFKFGVGSGGTMYGMQKNSEYIWNSPFYLWTQSAEELEITLTVEGPMAPYVYFGSTADNKFGGDVWHQGTFTYTGQHLVGSSGVTPDIKVVIPTDDTSNVGSGTSYTGTIVVTAVAK